MKRILDTVHGYIMVEDLLVDRILDTPCFQRLRRVEQTSIRSVYPSARHDRFIHSLGVYHIGCMIVSHLMNESNHWHMTSEKLGEICMSYKTACLLHDVAHSPFSHTFEEYFGEKEQLRDRLCSVVSNDLFTNDALETYKNDTPAFHEYMSAIITWKEYHTPLRELGADPELVVRMITGTYYNHHKNNHQIENCFISLLHGKIIDADRLDYACRDVWASGYSTSSIDLRRLVSAIHIDKYKGEWYVCFESNSLNEIEGFINVKDFQMKYVINHHTVNYEQWLLKEAANHMARRFCPNEENPKYSLGNILCEDALVRSKVINGTWTLKNLSDDDLIFLIKQDSDNPYYEEWASRQYSHFALWKSQDEFYHYFNGINRSDTDLSNNEFEPTVKAVLNSLAVPNEDILVNKAVFKPRINLSSLLLQVNHEVVRYTDLYKSKTHLNKNKVFYYVFIKKHGKDRLAIFKEKQRLIQALKQPVENLYKDSGPCKILTIVGNDFVQMHTQRLDTKVMLPRKNAFVLQLCKTDIIERVYGYPQCRILSTIEDDKEHVASVITIDDIDEAFLDEIETVNVYGVPFIQENLQYFEKIGRIVNPYNTFWHISYSSSEELEKINEFVKRLVIHNAFTFELENIFSSER